RAHRGHWHRSLSGPSAEPADLRDQLDRRDGRWTAELLSSVVRTMSRLFDSRGSSTLELVVVLPEPLFCPFSYADLTRSWVTLSRATGAAREGGRAGVVAAPNSVSTAGNAKIDGMLGNGNWSGGVSCAAAPCAADQIVSATVTLQFHTVVPLIMPAMFGTMNITQTATMRYE